MTGRAAAGIVATAVAAAFVCTAGGAALFGAGPAGCGLSTVISDAAPTPPAGGWPPVDRYQPDQIASATTIIAVGTAEGVPVRGWVVAVATAIQESSLRNLPGGDRDSIGLFQQRPSQGWGTPQQLRDPVYASRKFYAKLITIPRWERLPLTKAAQAVQVSAFPDAYARWEIDATTLVAMISGSGPWIQNSPLTPDTFACVGAGDYGQPGRGAIDLPEGWSVPADTPAAAATAIRWALAQLGTPYHLGGDCTDPRSGQPEHQCDCSSLVQVAYRTAGLALPRTTAEQIHAGRSVTVLALVRPGDLVFIPGSIGTPRSPGHVGMYIGDGFIVHAPRTGDVVKTTRLASWADQVAAVRRIARL